jgi:plasmid stabilization system protein ParE
MRVVLRRQAKLDLLAAHQWYEERQPGLGDALRQEVDAALHEIQGHPESHPRVDPHVRRAALRRFPYGIFYLVDEETKTIRVIAILHRARNPERWQRRR